MIKFMLVLPLIIFNFFLFAVLYPALASENSPAATSNQLNGSKSRRVMVALGGRTIQAVVADTDRALREGLLGWDRITDEDGMLLDFTVLGQYAIHMQGMKFPIDAVWIDSTGVIKLVYEDIAPHSGRVYPSMIPCRYCLEIKGGFCKKYGVKEGQTVRFGVPGK